MVQTDDGAKTAEDNQRRNFSTISSAFDTGMPKKFFNMKLATTYRPVNEKAWYHADALPKLLGTITHDKTAGQMTPRSKNRAITLDRNYNKFAWMYTRNNLETFDGPAIKQDKKKGLTLKRQIRMKKRSMAVTSRNHITTPLLSETPTNLL